MTATISKNENKNDQINFEKDISSSRNILIVILKILFFPFKILFFPFIWVFREVKRLNKFITKKSTDPMDAEEIAFVESIPVFFTIASIDLAIILGVIASIGFSDRVRNFISHLTDGLDGIVNMVGELVNLIKDLFSGLYNIIVNIIIGGIWNYATSLRLDPLILLILIIVLAVSIVVAIMIIDEMNIVSKVLRKAGYLGLGIAELPYAIYDSLDHFWMKFLKSFGRFISGRMVTSKQRTFYRKIIIAVTIYAIWTFIWGLLILTNELLEPTFSTRLKTDSTLIYKEMTYFIIVILLSGFLAGNILMLFLSRTLKKVTKEKYTAETKAVESVRHKSLVSYLIARDHLAVLSIQDLSRIVDISKDEIPSHFKDNALKEWILTEKSIVNKKLYEERIHYVEELVDEGLDNEDPKPLFKAIDYVTFMQKAFRNEKKYFNELEERKEVINEDIADIRGLLNYSATEES